MNVPMRVTFDWDEAYPVYSIGEYDPADKSWSNTHAYKVEIPRDLFERYIKARDEWDAVQEALNVVRKEQIQ